MKSDVTVIMPTYRHAEFIVQSLESVFGQTLQPDEIIVINDGSPDHTDQVIAPYLNRIHYIRQENQGVAKALNRAINISRTDYLLFLASDDWLDPAAIEVLRDILARHRGVGVAHANRLKVDEYMRPLPDGSVPHLGIYTDLPLMLTYYTTYTPAVMCRRDAILESGPVPEYRYCQDWALWISVALSGWHFYGTPEILGYYRRHPGNTSCLEFLEETTTDEISMLQQFVHSGRLSPCLIPVAEEAIRYRRKVLAWELIRKGRRAQAARLFTDIGRDRTDFNTLLGLTASALPTPLLQLTKMARSGLGR